MPKRTLGRPRDERVDEALLPAVRELLGEIGYPRTTVDAIANRAGVGKPAIYRRYRSKAELIFNVLLHGVPDEPIPDHGSLRADLTALVHRVHAMLSEPRTASVMPGLMSDMSADPELAQRFRDTFLGAQRDVVAELCARAVRRGELRDPPDTAFVHAQLLGPLFVRLIVLGEELRPAQLEAHVDGLLRVLGSD